MKWGLNITDSKLRAKQQIVLAKASKKNPQKTHTHTHKAHRKHIQVPTPKELITTNPASAEARRFPLGSAHLAFDCGFSGLKRPPALGSPIKVCIHVYLSAVLDFHMMSAERLLTTFLLITPWLIHSHASARVDIEDAVIIEKKVIMNQRNNIAGGTAVDWV